MECCNWTLFCCRALQLLALATADKLHHIIRNSRCSHSSMHFATDFKQLFRAGYCSRRTAAVPLPMPGVSVLCDPIIRLAVVGRRSECSRSSMQQRLYPRQQRCIALLCLCTYAVADLIVWHHAMMLMPGTCFTARRQQSPFRKAFQMCFTLHFLGTAAASCTGSSSSQLRMMEHIQALLFCGSSIGKLPMPRDLKHSLAGYKRREQPAPSAESAETSNCRAASGSLLKSMTSSSCSCIHGAMHLISKQQY
jgi:hypothetical protein